MLFAEEGFLRPPNVYDVVGVVGLFLAIWSIWQAKVDITKRIVAARADAIMAVRLTSVLRLLSDARHELEVAAEAQSGRRWRSAAQACRGASRRLSDALGQELLSMSEANTVRLQASFVAQMVDAFAAMPRETAGQLPDSAVTILSRVIDRLAEVEGRLHTQVARGS